MRNELRNVEEIKSYLRGMKSAKSLQQKQMCLENIKRINKELTDGVIGLDYFIAKYDNAKRFYKKDIDEILKNVESAIEVLKVEIKKETYAHVTKNEIEKKFENRCIYEYENYCENNDIDDVDYNYWGDEFKINNGFDNVYYYLMKLYDRIYENNNIDVKKLYEELIDEKDKKYIELRIDKNHYSKPSDNKIDLCLYSKVSCNWFWFEVSTSTPIADDKTIYERIVEGEYTITSIDYFEID